MGDAGTELRDRVEDILRQRGVVRAIVFGSFARGEDQDESEVDCLVEFEFGRSLWDSSGLRIELIEECTAGSTKDEFERSALVQDAVDRRSAVSGQAVNSIPPDVRARYPGVPWRDIAGTRDHIVHACFTTGTDLVRGIVSDRLVDLKAIVE
jgi:uncharacterized protein with HEPN domain